MRTTLATSALLTLLLTAPSALQERATAPRTAQEAPAQRFERAVTLLESRGDVEGAARLFQSVVADGDRSLAARALVYLGACHERRGDQARARGAYARVARDFPDQRAAVGRARTRLAALPASPRSPARTLLLRRFWPEGPPADMDIGTVSLDGRALALFGPTGALRLQDMRTAALGPLIPWSRTSVEARCVVWGVALAPDRTAAACSRQCGGGAVELVLVPLPPRAASASERVLHRAAPGELIEPLDWRRRGGILARVTRPDRSSALLVIAVDNGNTRTALTVPFVSAHASLSPDGRWVAYDAPDAGVPPRRDVAIVPVAGGAARVVAGGTADDLMPVWSPDGAALTWISDRTGTSGLWWQAMTDGTAVGAPRLVAPDLGRVAQPIGLTESGAYVYFRQTGLVDVHVVPLDDTGRRAGAASVEGTRYVGATMSPAWSRDGTRLAYRVELGVSRVHVIGIRDLATSEERIVAPAMSWIDMPRWSPDGTRLLVRGIGASGGYGFFMVDGRSGVTTAVKIVPLMEEDTLGAAQWEPSGRAVIYVQHRQFRRIDLDTMQDSTWFALPDGSSPLVLPDPGFALGSDGRVAYVQHAGGVTSLQVRGPDGTTREVVRAGSGERLGGVAWHRGHRDLLFTRTRIDPALAPKERWPAVWTVDIETLAARPLDIAFPRLRGIAPSPDGRRLAFTSGSPTREPWILEHFLPSSPPVQPEP